MTILTEAQTRELRLGVDPVCGMSVDREQALEHDLAITFAEREYLFCAPGCKATFVHEPTAYAVAGRDAP